MWLLTMAVSADPIPRRCRGYPVDPSKGLNGDRVLNLSDTRGWLIPGLHDDPVVGAIPDIEDPGAQLRTYSSGRGQLEAHWRSRRHGRSIRSVESVVDSGIALGREERLALAVEAADLGCWTWNMASGTTSWDERLEAMHGLPPGGFGGTFDDWVAALHPDDRAECIALVEEALANPGTYRLHHRSIWPDGSVHSIECRGIVLTDAAGQAIGTTGVAFDVTA